MIDVLAWVLTAIPLLAAAALGWRSGAHRMLALGGPIAAGWFAAMAIMLLGFWTRWREPFGLLTPVLVSIPVGVICRRAAGRMILGRLRQPSTRNRGERAGGALLGAGAATFAVASLWMAVAIGSAAFSVQASGDGQRPGAEARPGPFQALFEAANRGFIHHLPLAGPLGDEVEALTSILNADPKLRAQLAHDVGWEKLADLPSTQAIIRDQATLDDIDSVRKGELTTLYSLQKNPLILDFLVEAEVQKVLAETRPSILARKLEAMRTRASPRNRQ